MRIKEQKCIQVGTLCTMWKTKMWGKITYIIFTLHLKDYRQIFFNMGIKIFMITMYILPINRIWHNFMKKNREDHVSARKVQRAAHKSQV